MAEIVHNIFQIKEDGKDKVYMKAYDLDKLEKGDDYYLDLLNDIENYEDLKKQSNDLFNTYLINKDVFPWTLKFVLNNYLIMRNGIENVNIDHLKNFDNHRGFLVVKIDEDKVSLNAINHNDDYYYKPMAYEKWFEKINKYLNKPSVNINKKIVELVGAMDYDLVDNDKLFNEVPLTDKEKKILIKEAKKDLKDYKYSLVRK